MKWAFLLVLIGGLTIGCAKPTIAESQSAKPLADVTKNTGGDERISALLEQIRPVQDRIESEMETRQYRNALDDIQKATAFWKNKGMPILVPDGPERSIECYYQLGDYQAAIDIWSRNPHGGVVARGAVGLCLLATGNAAVVADMVSDEDILKHYGPPDEKRQMAEVLPKMIEVRLRLARGMEWEMHYLPKLAIPELEAANRLMPHNPVVALALGQAYAQVKLYDKARSMAPDVIKLGGPIAIRGQMLAQIRYAGG